MSRVVDCIVVHCSDSPDAMDIGRVEIDQWHKERGWHGIGYHYVVRRNGTIEVGRQESEEGAHALGYNAHSLGVVWVGRETQGEAQRSAMLTVLRELMSRYKVGPHRVFGHCELNPGRTCPNLDMGELRTELTSGEQ